MLSGNIAILMRGWVKMSSRADAKKYASGLSALTVLNGTKSAKNVIRMRHIALPGWMSFLKRMRCIELKDGRITRHGNAG